MKNRSTAIALFFVLTLDFSSMIQGQSFQNTPSEIVVEKLENYLISAKDAYKLNGSVLVAHQGKILVQGGYGWSNMDLRKQNHAATIFPILSITKPITAAVVLKLQEEKKLSVGDKLSQYFPHFPNGSNVTIHHLLTHSSGIHNYPDNIGIEDSLFTNYPIPKERMLDYIKSKPADFPPGKHYSYNNSGYYLLGLIIEKVTAKPYETVVREMIFNPLGMNHSGFDFNHLPDSLKAKGYQFLDAEKVIPYKHFDSTYAYSAGAIYSNVSDMYKWATAIASKQILSSASWRKAMTPKIRGYGYGWMTGEFHGKKYIRHSGGYPGYMSDFIYYPDEDLTIIILNNFGNYEQNVWAIGMGIACIVFTKPYDHFKIRKEVQLPDEVLSRYIGSYSLNKRRSIIITLKDGDLVVEIGGLPPMKLFAEGEHRFYLENFNTEYKFITGENGSITQLIIHEHGEDYKLKKTQ